MAALILPGSLSAEEMVYPVVSAVSGDGTIYVADQDYHGIWKVTGGTVVSYFKGSKKFRTPLNAVRCLAFDQEGKLLAGDSSTREVYRFDESGTPNPLTDGRVGNPSAIAVRKSGELLVADQELQCIWKIPSAGGAPVKFAEMQGVVGLCLDDQEQLWVTSRSTVQLCRIAPDGTIEKLLSNRPFQFPQHVALSDSKTAYVTDNYANAIWRVVVGKKPEKIAQGTPLVNPIGIVRSGEKLIVTDPRARALFEVDSAGRLTKIVPKS